MRPAELDLSHRQIMKIIPGLAAALLLATLNQTMVAPALPTIVAEYNRPDLISWLVSVFMLASAVAAPLYGKASDLYDRRLVLQTSIIMFLAGSALCAAAQSIHQLLGFRALQGLGAGGLISSAMAVVGDVVAPRERVRYQRYFVVVSSAAVVLGPLVGGLLVDRLSWRWVFLVNLPVGLVVLLLVRKTLRIQFSRRPAAVDWRGAGLLVVGIATFMLAVQGTNLNLSTELRVLVFAVCGTSLIALSLHERVVAEALLPPRLFTNRIFVVCALLGLVSGAVMFGTTVYLQWYFQVVAGLSPTRSGLQVLPFLAGILFAPQVSRRLLGNHGRYKRLVLAGSVTTTIGLALLSYLGEGSGSVTLMAWMCVTGSGLGLILENMTVAAQNTVDRRDMGVATSTITLSRMVGGALGASVVGALMTADSNIFLAMVPLGVAAVALGAFLRDAELRGAVGVPISHRLIGRRPGRHRRALAGLHRVSAAK
jgi:EmrB/QacA subfamily drug resistance transporter